MKKFALMLTLLAAFAWAGSVLADGKAQTQKYEVVCLKCMAHNASMGKNGGHGAGHAACAMSCATKGTDLGLMDSKGNLYVPIGTDFQPVKDSFKDKAGQTIEVTGTVVKTKGINYLMVSGSDDKAGKAAPSVEKAKDKDGD